ncbi:MAG: YeeE/YedE thiosulfate transporter family protein [Thermoplasmatota archaeon]
MLAEIRENNTARLLTALGIGFAFGFLLQKGGATDYEVIVNQLLFRDFTVFKIIFSAILTGMIGVYMLVYLGITDLSIKPCNIYAIVVGGLIFGAGFALLGYCPGTMAGAVGTGSVHALVGIGGILAGAGLFASLYTGFQEKWDTKNLGEITIPEILDVHPWIVVLFVGAMIIISLYLIEVST